MNILEKKFPAFTNEFLKERLCTNLKFCPMEFWFFDGTGTEQRVLEADVGNGLSPMPKKWDLLLIKKCITK